MSSALNFLPFRVNSRDMRQFSVKTNDANKMYRRWSFQLSYHQTKIANKMRSFLFEFDCNFLSVYTIRRNWKEPNWTLHIGPNVENTSQTHFHTPRAPSVTNCGVYTQHDASQTKFTTTPKFYQIEKRWNHVQFLYLFIQDIRAHWYWLYKANDCLVNADAVPLMMISIQSDVSHFGQLSFANGNHQQYKMVLHTFHVHTHSLRTLRINRGFCTTSTRRKLKGLFNWMF